MTAADPVFPGASDAGAGFTPSPPWRARDSAQSRGAWSSSAGDDDARPRILTLMIGFALAFAALAVGATHAALFAHQPPPRPAPPPIRPDRADLLDRNGEVLATDVVRYGLYLRPAEIADKAAAARILTESLPRAVKPRQIATALAGRTAGRPASRASAPAAFNPLGMVRQALFGSAPVRGAGPDQGREVFVADDLTQSVRDAIEARALPGAVFQEERARFYPLGQTGAHVIGYAGKDGQGQAGAERAFDRELRAQAGGPPPALSVDLRVQAALQDEVEAAADHFGVKDAVGLVVNVRTGEILAMESYPAFDANAPGKVDALALASNTPSPTINHVAASIYEPGSVFKVFTVAMLLDSGVANLTTRVDVHTPLMLQGQTIHDYDKKDRLLGSLTLSEVFTHSSNIGAAKLSLSAGAERMEHYFRAFGLLARAPSELVESAHPQQQDLPLSRNSVATYGFGHAISVSPLALATGMSAILNGGIYRPLTLRPLAPGAAPAPGTPVIRPETSRTMLDLMRLNATTGTGRAADALAPGYRVGGKTGTATKLRNGHYNHQGINLASFAAVFPTDGPLDADRYLVLVMMDEPRATPETHGFTTGGVVAAPIAGRVIARIAPLLGVARVGGAPAPAPAALDPVALAGGER
jgi:cell division protein FtsI (penicillin-binding protein 3)